jgi:hypothetical protein
VAYWRRRGSSEGGEVANWRRRGGSEGVETAPWRRRGCSEEGEVAQEEERWLIEGGEAAQLRHLTAKQKSGVLIRLLPSPWQTRSVPRWVATWDGTVLCAGL